VLEPAGVLEPAEEGERRLAEAMAKLSLSGPAELLDLI
jgi:hypothetical protein